MPKIKNRKTLVMIFTILICLSGLLILYSNFNAQSLNIPNSINDNTNNFPSAQSGSPTITLETQIPELIVVDQSFTIEWNVYNYNDSIFYITQYPTGSNPEDGNLLNMGSIQRLEILKFVLS